MGSLRREDLTADQRVLIDTALAGSRFLSGPAGTGKTTVAIFRLAKMIEAGIDPGSILVLVPQRRLGDPYRLNQGLAKTYFKKPEIVTVAGLARRMIELFWPLIAAGAGFSSPDEPPKFLTLETAQFYMSRVVGPYLDEGYFESLNLDRFRLYRQILDNLNKAAVVGFPITEISTRLSEAWIGPDEQTRVYDQAQQCALQFRQACFANNLVDFSLQYELFFDAVKPLREFQDLFSNRYQHFIVDNIEEETPLGHDFVAKTLATYDSALVICDHDGGFSRFLGADPGNLNSVRAACEVESSLEQPLIMSDSVAQFSSALHSSINREETETDDLTLQGIEIHSAEFLPDLVGWVAREIETLVGDGTGPAEIAVVSPFVSDALRFLLTDQLDHLGIPWASHRPSRAIADEAYNRCLLTFAAISHPEWEIKPGREEVAHSIMLALGGIDLIRASLLANTVYRIKEGSPTLASFAQLRTEMQERIGYHLGDKYERLREWILGMITSPRIPLDQFVSKLFGELLSQPGFGYHSRMDAGRAAAAMIASIQKFRSVASGTEYDSVTLGKTYYELIKEGLLAAQYRASELNSMKEAVFIAPAFTYLTMNLNSSVQFWLDIGSPAWAERLYQPLTHPYVLSRTWQRGRKWSDEDEQAVRREIAATSTTGLARRCRRKIYLCHSTIGEQGLEQSGILLSAIQQVLSKAINAPGAHDV